MNELPLGSRLVRLLAATERGVIGGLMAALFVLTLAQVIWRYVLGNPFQWSEEGARYCFLWVTLLGAAALLRVRDGHPRIDTLSLRAGPRLRSALDGFS